MGLEGVHLNQSVASLGVLQMDMIRQIHFAGDITTNACIPNPFAIKSGDGDNSQFQIDLIVQAQRLLKKNRLFEEISLALHKSKVFQPFAHNLLVAENDEEHVTCAHRNAAVNNLRFLNIFYGYKPAIFAIAVNLLDRLLGKVKANSKFLSCIATSCFYIAVKSQENQVFIPNVSELVKLSQCGGSPADLLRMEQLILEKLQWLVDAVTPLTFLHLFYDMLVLDKDLHDQQVLSDIVSNLNVILCHHEIAMYRMETVALALVSLHLQELGFVESINKYSLVVELQFYCQIPDEEFLQCRHLIIEYLNIYKNQASKLPRLQLTWTVSRRTLNKMKPSTKYLSDLEPIMEDEDDNGFMYNDAGPFDSENEESELERQIRSMRLKSNENTKVQMSSSK